MQTGGKLSRERLKKFYSSGQFRRRKGGGDKSFWRSIIGSSNASESMTKSLSKAKRKFNGGPIDGIPAMLTEGEFVVNAASTAKNFNALVHANNGGLIQGIGDSSPQMGAGGFGGGDFGSIMVPDISENTGATNANTQALMMLAQSLQQMASRSSIPRGSDVRMGVSY